MAGSQVRHHPGGYWDERDDPELAAIVAHDFIAERWDRTVAAVLAQADDDAATERMLHTIVGNWLIDKFRETDRGSVTRTLTKHLADRDEFEKVPAGQEGAGRWRLAGSAQPPCSASLDGLVAAAWTVPARAVRWASDTRRAPIAAPTELSAVLRAVLAAAAGSMTEQQLVEVVVRRFPATLSTPVHPPVELDTSAEAVADRRGSADQQWQARDDAGASENAAGAVIRQLTAEERRLLWLSATFPPARAAVQVQQELRCGRSKAYQHLDRVRAIVRELTAAADDGEQVVRNVLALCRAEFGQAEDTTLGTTVDGGAGAPSDSRKNPVITGRGAS